MVIIYFLVKFNQNPPAFYKPIFWITAKNEIVKLISNHLSEHPNLSNKEIEKQAENAYLHLTYGVINSFTRKIASSIGSKEALEVYREMEKNVGTPAFLLIRQAIELQFNKHRAYFKLR